MFHSSTRKSLSLYSALSVIQKPLTVALVALGLVSASSSYFVARAVELAAKSSSMVNQSASVTETTEYQGLPDGVYLYGQSTEPEQIGSSYMVFEVTDSKVVGAFYMPYSSFDCFQGEFQADRLALNVVSSYEQVVHPYEVALQANSSVASTDEAVAPVGLEGYHQIEAFSDTDRRILATCQADFAE